MMHRQEVAMAPRLGYVLYVFFRAVAGAWMTLVAAGFVWSDTFNIFAAMVGLVLAAASWLIGRALRHVLGADDVMSKFSRYN
jgi:hypothetical protein